MPLPVFEHMSHPLRGEGLVEAPAGVDPAASHLADEAMIPGALARGRVVVVAMLAYLDLHASPPSIASTDMLEGVYS
jgi:hypothetical protein